MLAKFPALSANARLWLGVIGMALTVLAIMLVFRRMDDFSSFESEAMLIASDIDKKQSALHVLQTRIEAKRTMGTHETMSQEEKAASYILPQEIDRSRVIHVVTTVIESVVRKTFEGSLRFADTGETTSLVISWQGDVEQASKMMQIFSLNGSQTVSDAFADNGDAFLEKVESFAPMSLANAEEFLRTDILRYASDPEVAEAAVLHNLPAIAASELSVYLLESPLKDIRMALSPIAKELSDAQAWPLPAMTARSITIDGENVSLILRLHTK